MSLVGFIGSRFNASHFLPRSVRTMRFVAVIGIGVAVAALVIAVSIGNGFEKEYRRALLGFNSHLMIMKMGEIENSSKLIGEIKGSGIAEIVGVTPFIYREALAIGGGGINGIIIKGIDPQSVRNVTDVKFPVPEGMDLAQLLSSGRKNKMNVIVGRSFFARTGRPKALKLMIPTDGEQRFIDIGIVGTFESGINDYDSQFFLASIPELARFYDIKEGTVTGIELRLTDPFEADSVAKKIELELGPGYQMTTWSELNRDLLSAVQLEKLVSMIIMGIMVVVAMLNIVAVMVLMLIYRMHEVAVLKAIGLSDAKIRAIFIRSGMRIDAMGTLFGMIVGIALSSMVGGLKLIPLEAEIYLIKSLPIDISPAICGMIAAFSILFGYAASKIVSFKLSRVSVAEGLSCAR